MKHMHIESNSVAWFYPSGTEPQYGSLTDSDFGESFDKIAADEKKWRQHVVDSFDSKQDLDKVFCLIANKETTYVSPNYNHILWHVKAPAVEVGTFDPSEIKTVHKRV